MHIQLYYILRGVEVSCTGVLEPSMYHACFHSYVTHTARCSRYGPVININRQYRTIHVVILPTPVNNTMHVARVKRMTSYAVDTA